ncbi:MAG: hypothetical protein IKQ72_01965 [Bacteroidaceae bacterium]|nr:hypothetical protein [Bacteroidaceae bacterium]
MWYPCVLSHGHKNGVGDYRLSFYLRIIDAFADNIGIPDESAAIRRRGAMALLGEKG